MSFLRRSSRIFAWHLFFLHVKRQRICSISRCQVNLLHILLGKYAVMEVKCRGLEMWFLSADDAARRSRNRLGKGFPNPFLPQRTQSYYLRRQVSRAPIGASVRSFAEGNLAECRCRSVVFFVATWFVGLMQLFHRGIVFFSGDSHGLQSRFTQMRTCRGDEMRGGLIGWVS